MRINDFHEELKRFIDETGMSVNKIASEADVPQSQVWGWAKKRGVRYTENSEKVMKFIKNYRKSIQQTIPQDIEDAINKVLSINPEKEKLIYEVIKAVGKG